MTAARAAVGGGRVDDATAESRQRGRGTYLPQGLRSARPAKRQQQQQFTKSLTRNYCTGAITPPTAQRLQQLGVTKPFG